MKTKKSAAPGTSARPGRPRVAEKRINIGLKGGVVSRVEALAAAERRSVSMMASILLEEALGARDAHALDEAGR